MADQLDSLYWKLLVIRCQAGDRAAFEELVAHCQARIRGFLFKLIGGGERVDDLAQEVWMDVFRDLPKLNDPGAFLPWLYRIARNRAFRVLRRRARPFGSIEQIDIAERTDAPDDFTTEDAAAVHSALDRLGPEHREVLLLRFIDDLSYEQIAAVVGCQMGTVKSRLHNAKRALRRVLEKGVSL
jgi:RNA polymerase sigma-70 factor (ECF subfamily)